MNVHELMTSSPRTVRGYENLAVAAAAMWQDDCGVLPVVDDANRVIGIITDRDICMALATRNRPASEVSVGEVIARPPLTCTTTDTVETALDTMKSHQVRRLPVVDDYGRVEGILSINDILLASGGKGSKVLSTDAVVQTLKGICGHADLPIVSTTTTGAVVVSAKKTTKKSGKSNGTKQATAKKAATKSTTTSK